MPTAQPHTQPAPVQTTASTIQVVLPPTAKIQFWENPSIVVPLATFVGVLCTIYFGWWKTKEELKAAKEKADTDRTHAANQARQDRLTKARRETYLQLIKDMNVATLALSSLPIDSETGVDFETGFSGLLTAAGQVSILGEMDTVEKAREVVLLVQELRFRMQPTIIEIRSVKESASELRATLAKQSDIKEGLMETARDRILNGGQKYKGSSLEKGLESTNESIKKKTVTLRAHEDAISAALEYYQGKVGMDMHDIIMKIDELIVCLRRELELETNEQVLLDTSERMHNSLLENFFSGSPTDEAKGVEPAEPEKVE